MLRRQPFILHGGVLRLHHPHRLPYSFDGRLGVMLNAVMDSRTLTQADLDELSAILEKAKGGDIHD